MKRILSAIKFDVSFQLRHGFYYAYLVISALYIFILLSLTGEVKETAAVMLIFSDTSVLGFFFIGGIVLLERDQNTLESLFVTPLRLGEYIAAKTISLTILSVVMSGAILLLSFGPRFNPVPMLAGVIFSSVFFTFLGIVISVRSKSINLFLMKSGLGIFIVFLPLLDYFRLVDTPVVYIFPTQASLLLLDAGFKGISAAEAAYSFLALGIWAVIAGWLAYKNFYRHMILKAGGRG